MRNSARACFILGDCVEQGKMLRKSVCGSVVLADNDEVLALIGQADQGYIVIGENAYASFTVRELVDYNRALLGAKRPTDKQVRAFFRQAFGQSVSVRRRVGRLTTVQYRGLTAFSKLTEQTKKVALNLSGLPYCAKSRREIKGLIGYFACKSEVTVLISDARFACEGNRVIYADGKNDNNCLKRIRFGGAIRAVRQKMPRFLKIKAIFLHKPAQKPAVKKIANK